MGHGGDNFQLWRSDQNYAMVITTYLRNVTIPALVNQKFKHYVISDSCEFSYFYVLQQKTFKQFS